MREPIIKVCEWCGKEFQAKTKYVKTCSSKCSHALAVKVCNDRGKRFKRYLHVDDSFLQNESNEKYYFLGLMASDGNVRKSSISISQSGEEGIKLICYLKDLLKSDANIYEYKPPVGKIVYTLSFRSEQIMQDLENNNIGSCKTHTFSVPDYVLQDENKFRYFLIEYIDGDGCVGRYNGNPRRKQDTYYYLNISFVCNSLMYNQLKNREEFKDSKVVQKRDDLYEFRFNGLNAIYFSKWLYKDNTSFHSYKYLNCMDYLNNLNNFLSENTKKRYVKREIYRYLDSVGVDNNITSKQISEKFNITLKCAENVKYDWRLKHGISRKIKKSKTIGRTLLDNCRT